MAQLASNLICREQAIEFGIQVIVVRVIAVLRVPAEILPENVRRRGLSLDQQVAIDEPPNRKAKPLK